MTHAAINDAVQALRQAGLFPTQIRLAALSLAYSGPLAQLGVDELCERARDEGVCLTEQVAATTLAELRQAGILPSQDGRSGQGGRQDWQARARRIKALANAHRLRLLQELSGGELCAGDLGRLVGLKPSALSQHLARLKADGLVRPRRQASHIFYSLDDDAAQGVKSLLAA